ncbi:MAG: glycosyltransferase family 2 protein [Chloroflexota bacterium]|nr:glycosyltransferase family 2 protein [Chloroflexota bacterium]
MAAVHPYLSVVVPAYNEMERLPRTLPAIVEFLSAQGYTYEVVVADDGSTDSTREAVRAIAARFPRVRLLELPHRGKAFAVRKGMLDATGDRILFTDADLSAPISQVRRLMRCLDEGYDLAIGSREAPGARRYSEPVHRHLMGRVYNLAVRVLTGHGFQDTQCGFKLFTREAAHDIFNRLLLYADDAPPVSGPMVTGLDVEVLQVACSRGYRVAEVGVEWHYTPGSKVKPALDTYRMLKDLTNVRLNDLRGRYR